MAWPCVPGISANRRADFLSPGAHGNRSFSTSPCICSFTPTPLPWIRYIFFSEATWRQGMRNFSPEKGTVAQNHKICTMPYSRNFMGLGNQEVGGLLLVLPTSLFMILLCLFLSLFLFLSFLLACFSGPHFSGFEARG